MKFHVEKGRCDPLNLKAFDWEYLGENDMWVLTWKSMIRTPKEDQVVPENISITGFTCKKNFKIFSYSTNYTGRGTVQYYDPTSYPRIKVVFDFEKF